MAGWLRPTRKAAMRTGARMFIVFGGVANDETMATVLKEAIDRMCGRDMMFVLRLCEGLRWELPSALEEESFRWRNARLGGWSLPYVLPQDVASVRGLRIVHGALRFQARARAAQAAGDLGGAS